MSSPTRQSHKTRLSKLQYKWLERAYGNDVDVAVICGCPDGGVVMTEESWDAPWTREQFREELQCRKDLALWITNRVGAR